MLFTKFLLIYVHICVENHFVLENFLAKCEGEEFSVRNDNTFINITGTQCLVKPVLHLHLLRFMVEDVPFPLKYRYEGRQSEIENQNYHNERDQAT